MFDPRGASLRPAPGINKLLVFSSVGRRRHRDLKRRPGRCRSLPWGLSAAGVFKGGRRISSGGGTDFLLTLSLIYAAIHAACQLLISAQIVPERSPQNTNSI